ncbi:MAG: hypothetical protein QXO94_01205 [Candidatus Bathyarchaeia archaeon]
MTLSFCRNCINLIERRDMEGFVACVKNHRPGIACEDFTPVEGATSGLLDGMGFCLYCKNLTIVDQKAVCARNHRPGIACEDFRDAFRELKKLASIRRFEVARVRVG